MKINIDEKMFNKSIASGSLEVANFLLENSCETSYLAYLQNFDIKILDWLYAKGIPLDKRCLHEVIGKCGDVTILTWFIDKGISVDDKCLNVCIKNKHYELFDLFVGGHKVELTVDNFKSAILSEDYKMLDYLKQQSCPYDESVLEVAIKYSKKFSIKWLVTNGFF